MTMPIPIRQMSFAPTDHSSVLSNSPPQFRQSFTAGAGGATTGTSASPIEAVQQLALQAFLNGDMSTPRSPHGSGGVVTPPPHESLNGGSIVGGAGLNGLNGNGHNIQTFAPASPPTAPTSFSTLTGNGDKVSEWAAQQFMLQFAQERASATGNNVQGEGRKRTESMSAGMGGGFAIPTGSFSGLSGRIGGGGSHHNPAPGNGSGSAQAQLGATHQALLVNHPQLAAVAFPPPFAESVGGGGMPLPSPLESVYSSHSLVGHAHAHGHGLGLGGFGHGGGSTLWSPSLHSHSQSQTQMQGATATASQMQQFFAANAAAVASLNPALQGMTYGDVEQWMRGGSQAQGMSRGPGGAGAQGGKGPSMEEFREAVRAGINLGLAGLA